MIKSLSAVDKVIIEGSKKAVVGIEGRFVKEIYHGS